MGDVCWKVHCQECFKVCLVLPSLENAVVQLGEISFHYNCLETKCILMQ